MIPQFINFIAVKNYFLWKSGIKIKLPHLSDTFYTVL